MRDNGILKGFITNFESNGQKSGLVFGFRKMFRDYYNKTNVPFYDPCCPDASLSGAPVSYESGLRFFDAASETWVSVDSAQSVTALTAFATGGQASATQLSGGFNEVTVAATAGDSVKLPAAAEGLVVTVKNEGVAAIDVFPATADTINDGAANAAIRVLPGATVTFTAISAVNWETNSQVLQSSGGVLNPAGTQIAAFYPQVAQDNIAAAAGGAIPVTNYLTTINTDAGGDAFTLADGTQVGQMKKILLVADGGGDGVVTPATPLAGGTTITFDDAGDYVILQWSGAAWVVLENSGTVIA